MSQKLKPVFLNLIAIIIALVTITSSFIFYQPQPVLAADPTYSTWTQTSDTDFNEGVFDSSAVIGTGTEASLGLMNSVKAIAAGEDHTCALLSNGSVECWGYNEYGQLGNGTTTNSTTPVPVSGIDNASAIAAGEDHTCALLSDGSVECWGWNGEGELGDGTTNNSTTPVPVSEISDVSAITAGEDHTCALLSDNSVKCWGRNAFGQLGDGTTNDSTTPVSVSGITNASAITAGEYHTCALSDGSVKCWGFNYYGELGNGTTTFYTATPISVSGIASTSAITAGDYYTCALLSDNSVKCWGRNAFGQLGDGTTNDSTTPVSVSGITNASAITAGGAHTCALLSDGSVECWGYNGEGELGDGTTNNSTIPVPVSGIDNASAITAGGAHTCALLSDGSVECWGDNEYGQLGNGTAAPNTTIPLPVSGIDNASAITAGGAHTCALFSNSSVECWGFNHYGELGDGTTTNSTTPVPVSGIASTSAITTGEDHTCALLSNGSVECWGYNEYGQLGNGTTTNSTTPVPVSGIASTSAITAGWNHTCALLSDGSVECWGLNRRGQLGNGTTNNSNIPVSVSNISSSVSAITAGEDHTCALLSDNSVECWGNNYCGQLGNGTTTNSTTPVPVSGIDNASAITAGGNHTCALLSNGSVECWGDNAYGELGNGTTTASNVPVSVSGIASTSAITTGEHHTCALLSNGSVECWGRNYYGELGDGTTNDSNVPVPVSGIDNASAITAGDYYTCALLSDGSMECWGDNEYGQLGIVDTTVYTTPALASELPLYPFSGTFVSPTQDLGQKSNFATISWLASTTPSTTVKFQIATNNDNSTWNFVGPDGTADTYYTSPGEQINSSHNGNRYIRYKAYLRTMDSSQSPRLYSVTISYYPFLNSLSKRKVTSILPPISITGQGDIIQNLGGQITKTLESGQTARVIFPPDSIKGIVAVKIEPKDKAEVIKNNPLPKNTQIVGDLLGDFVALHRGEEIDSFKKEVSIFFTYSDNQLKESGVDEKTLKIYAWDEETKTWKPLRSELNTSAHRIRAYTTHFTLFAVMGKTKEENKETLTTKETGQQEIEEGKNSPNKETLTTKETPAVVYENIPSGFTFEKNLKYNDRNNDVKYLQIILKNEVPETYPANIPISGWFDSITKASVIAFQEKYSDEILTPWHFAKGTGFVGPTTRAKLNSLLSSAVPTQEKESAPEISGIPAGYKFTTNLNYGQIGEAVRCLQMFLKSQGSKIYPEGIVSGWFGPLTKKAVIRFQEKYASDILTPWRLTKGTGFVGETTRTKINEILGR